MANFNLLCACFCRQLRQEGLVIINICIALLVLYVAFIISSLAPSFETHDPPNGSRGCALFSAVLEYISLVYFAWIVAEAALLFWEYSRGRVSNKVLIIITVACWGE